MSALRRRENLVNRFAFIFAPALLVTLGAGILTAQIDPGVRAGAAGAGAPLPGLTAPS